MSKLALGHAAVEAILRLIVDNRDALAAAIAARLEEVDATSAPVPQLDDEVTPVAALPPIDDGVIRLRFVGPGTAEGVRAFATNLIVIGSALSCHIITGGDSLQQHAVITRMGREVWLNNLDPNGRGVSVNHSAAAGGHTVTSTYVLKPGEWAHIGDTFISLA